MATINTDNYHPDWQRNRILWMLSLYPEEFWDGKTVLELAPCNGVIGDYFRSIGANVISIEGRTENIKEINERFPELDVRLSDLDRIGWPYGNFDIIINFGLFYHLENYHTEHLKNCINHCNLMFFESVIYDSGQAELYTTLEKVGNDQSLSGVGKTPSTKYVEDIFKEMGCTYTKYSDKCLNSVNQIYDWEETGKRNYSNGNRRMWIVEPKEMI